MKYKASLFILFSLLILPINATKKKVLKKRAKITTCCCLHILPHGFRMQLPGCQTIVLAILEEIKEKKIEKEKECFYEKN